MAVRQLRSMMSLDAASTMNVNVSFHQHYNSLYLSWNYYFEKSYYYQPYPYTLSFLRLPGTWWHSQTGNHLFGVIHKLPPSLLLQQWVLSPSRENIFWFINVGYHRLVLALVRLTVLLPYCFIGLILMGFKEWKHDGYTPWSSVLEGRWILPLFHECM